MARSSPTLRHFAPAFAVDDDDDRAPRRFAFRRRRYGRL
jgi:hypothetical protein